MQVLIVGAGEVGFHLARHLSEEGQDVVVIEADPDRATFASQQLDVLTVAGNGASLPVLEEAGVKKSQLLLAVTSRDEVNLIACLAAKQHGIEYAVARISNPEYYEGRSVLSREQLGIDLMISPERECARDTYQLLEVGVAHDVARFADGRIELVGLRVREGAPVAGRTLADLGEELQRYQYTTVAIVRNGTTEIPRGDSRIEAEDDIYLLAPTKSVADIPPLAGYKRSKLERVMIAGGSSEGAYLASLLEGQEIDCTVIDRDRRRCLELAERLPRSLVLHADATDLELLEMEGVSGIDGYVAATGNDETNLLSSLLAKSVGARKVVSLIHKFEYLRLVPRVGLDAAVSPRISTVNAILRYVRRGRVMTVAGLTGTDAEAIEFQVGEESEIANRPLRDVDFPKGGVIGAVMRGDEILLPRGDDVLLPGDDVVVFALADAVPEVEKLFG